MKTKCAVCYKRFDAVIKRNLLNDDIQDIYFQCPRCGEQYHVAYTNAEIRAYNEKMQKVKDRLLLDKGNTDLLREMQDMMKHHLEMMNKLNDKPAKEESHGYARRA